MATPIELTHNGAARHSQAAATAFAHWPEAEVEAWLKHLRNPDSDITRLEWRSKGGDHYVRVQRKPAHECPADVPRQLTVHRSGSWSGDRNDDAAGLRELTDEINALNLE